MCPKGAIADATWEWPKKKKKRDNLTLDCSRQKSRGRKGNERKINNICHIFKEINLLYGKLIRHTVCSVPASSYSQTNFYGWYSSWQIFLCVLLCKALLTVLAAIKPLAKLLLFPSCGKLSFYRATVKMLEHSIRNTNSPFHGLNCDSSAPCITPDIFLASSHVKIMPLPIYHTGGTAVNETSWIVQVTGLHIACVCHLCNWQRKRETLHFFPTWFPPPPAPFRKVIYILHSPLISLFLSPYIILPVLTLAKLSRTGPS